MVGVGGGCGVVAAGAAGRCTAATGVRRSTTATGRCSRSGSRTADGREGGSAGWAGWTGWTGSVNATGALVDGRGCGWQNEGGRAGVIDGRWGKSDARKGYECGKVARDSSPLHARPPGRRQHQERRPMALSTSAPRCSTGSRAESPAMHCQNVAMPWCAPRVGSHRRPRRGLRNPPRQRGREPPSHHQRLYLPRRLGCSEPLPPRVLFNS